jgi:uncharacterized protein YcaQ
VVGLSNREIRRALLAANGLGRPRAGDARGLAPAARVLALVRELGFVQVDSVSAIERAQHHVLFTRFPRYRPSILQRLLERERALFESWTHDAAVLPVEVYPYWKHYLARTRAFAAQPAYRRYFSAVTAGDRARVLRRLAREGPLRPRDLATRKVDWHDPYFARPTVGKLTLELLWRTGRLAVTRRDGQEKVYDLAERVIPAEHFGREVSPAAYVDWACREALRRLVVGTPAQIARFFDAVSTAEAARWCARARRGTDLVEARYTHADGTGETQGFALAAALATAREAPAAPRSVRLLNPFDPLIHDRQRTRRVFGFDYTVEIWVPAARRTYGYYVLPVLEGERFTARVDAKAERSADRLAVSRVWWEPGVVATPARRGRLARALGRLARFAGVSRVDARDLDLIRVGVTPSAAPRARRRPARRRSSNTCR